MQLNVFKKDLDNLLLNRFDLLSEKILNTSEIYFANKVHYRNKQEEKIIIKNDYSDFNSKILDYLFTLNEDIIEEVYFFSDCLTIDIKLKDVLLTFLINEENVEYITNINFYIGDKRIKDVLSYDEFEELINKKNVLIHLIGSKTNNESNNEGGLE